jgi:hypothetical protein
MTSNMANKPSTTEFGKRRPAPLPASPPPKRSSHVALLVMGTLAVGGGAYALMRPENCQPASSGVASPAQPQTQAACTSRGSSFTSSHGNYSRTMHLSFFGGGDSSSHSSSSGTTESGSVSRGGFGGFAHAFGFSGRS